MRRRSSADSGWAAVPAGLLGAAVLRTPNSLPGLIGRRPDEAGWLLERLQPVARQQVRGSVAVRAAGSEAQESRSRNSRSDRLAQLRQVVCLGEATASRVSGDGRPAEVGCRCEPGQDSGDCDSKPAAAGLLRRVL